MSGVAMSPGERRQLERWGAHLRKLREARELSQVTVNTGIGFSATTNAPYSKYENGLSWPRVPTAVKLAAVLGVTLDELFRPVRL